VSFRGFEVKVYRTDIDGLRSIAVIPVVLFHIGFAIFTGGFIGVDVFFVISGYLITSSLNEDFEKQRYSIAAFYERRIRRIFPALIAVIFCTALAGAVLLLPDELKDLGQSIWGACLFVSNITFWLQSGDYFGITSERQPLLHTWSLAVEEQFYIFFPLFLALLHRSPRRSVTIGATVFLFVASLALSIYATHAASVANFYLLPTRAWELLAGSLIAFGVVPAPSTQRRAEIESALGLILIVVPLFAYGPQTPFPGLAALPPVAGAFLIIHAGTAAYSTMTGRLLSLRVPRFFGLISYSLYLWHWPVIVYSRYVLLELSPVAMVVIALVSVGLATLSWRYIERPFRRPGLFKSRTRMFVYTAALLCAGSLCGLMFKLSGLPHRFSPALIAMADKRTYQGPRRDCGLAFDKRRTVETLCALGAPNTRPDFLVIGDSHGDAAAPAVFEAASVVGRSGYQITATGYRPVIGFRKIGEPEKYAYLNKLTLNLLDHHPEIKDIVIPMFWRQAVSFDTYEDDGGKRFPGATAVENGLRSLAQRYPDRRFLLLLSSADSPLFGGDAAARAVMFHHTPFFPTVPRETFAEVEAAYAPVVQHLSALPNVSFASFAAKLCDDQFCHGMLNGSPAYSDTNHLSFAAAKLIEPDVERFLRMKAVPSEGSQSRLISLNESDRTLAKGEKIQ
jgi:peptidoglycan/LPS O-acetylase OafA/YrhL